MHTRSRFSTAAVAGAVLGVAVLGGAPALAAWSTSGAGTGAAQATSLVTPTSVTATGASNTTMTISWSAANQLSGATYQVVRNGNQTLSCTSSPCTDSGLTAGTTYSYVVSSKIGTNWVKSASAVNGTTTAALTGTTTTVGATTPAKSGSSVTLTATVAPSAATGSVTFKDNGTTITCTGGNARPVSSGAASCQTTFSAVGAHPITATYSGDNVYATSTSTSVTQRVVNSAVTGLAFSNVTGGTLGTCTGIGTANLSCPVSGAANSATVSAQVAFVNASGTPTTYSDAATNLPWTGVSKSNNASGTLTVQPNATTSTGSASVTKSGSNSGTITITFSDGANSFTATLTTN